MYETEHMPYVRLEHLPVHQAASRCRWICGERGHYFTLSVAGLRSMT
ncbi:MAG: hypothetical protein HY908_32630 [Myxococcales bacterium]|nr:hypothetical protein [Myxococcales bacterium]